MPNSNETTDEPIPRKIKIGVILVLIAVLAGAIAAYALKSSGRTSAEEVLAHGNAGGTEWELRGKVEAGALCMDLTSKDGAEFVGGFTQLGWNCGFDNREMGPSGEPFGQIECPEAAEGGDLASSSCIWFGPAPADAATVRLGENLTVPVHKFTERQFPDATYWYSILPPGYPTEADGKTCEFYFENEEVPAGHCAVEALDADGKVIPFGGPY